MAKEIPEELKTFKDKVNGKLGSMSSGANTIVSKINDLVSQTNSTKGEVAVNYQSSTEVNQATSKLASTSEFMSSMASDISSTISGAIGKATSVIEKINKLETIKEEIATQESIISSERAKKEPNTSTISAANCKKAEKESEFDTTCEEAKSELSALKSMDKSASKGSDSAGGASGVSTDTKTDKEEKTESTLSTYTGYLQKLAYGTFTKNTYNSKYGKLTYYLYLPDKAESTTGLPVMLWLHGGKAYGTGMGSLTGYGLCPQIEKKEVTPNGIVVLPHIADFEGASGANYRKAVVELTNYVVDKYKADKKRVSIAGASYGAITGYTIINENPGMFSAFVPISGWNKITDEFKNVKVWAFHGARDNNGNRTTYKGAVSTLEQIKSMGGQATMTAFENMWHSNVQTKALTVTKAPDGKNENYLDWAMSQVRS